MSKKDDHRISDVFYNVNLLEGAIPVEQEDGTFALKNFTIIKAGLSANRNYYPADVLRANFRIFKDTQIRTDHPSASRGASVRDIVGKIVNPRFSESDKTVRGDAVFSSVEKDLITKIKERLIGDISINAFGTTMLEKGPDGKTQRRVKAINAASSVDLVCEASAGGTLHEEKRQTSLICERMVENMTALDNLTKEELLRSRPDLVEAIQKEVTPPPATSQSAPATVDVTTITESVGKVVDGKLAGFEKRMDEKDAARALAEAISVVVNDIIEESTMIEEAKPLIRKSLTVYAAGTFKELSTIDKAKLSEERDAMLKNLEVLSEKMIEGKLKEEKDEKKKKGGKKDKQSVHNFGL